MSDRPADGGLSYRQAGVDREAASRAKDRILRLVRSTHGEGVVGNEGGFGGLFRVPGGYDAPILVSSADGVGTKLKVAMRAGRHDTVGEDLVNHCVNDILVEGAEPLFFLDYIGMGRLEEGTVEAVVEGVARGCRANGCALLGGETAEMPDFYAPGEYDLAGFVVGVVEQDARPGRDRVRADDVLLGVAGDGFHTNGYSLLRSLLFDRLGLGVDDPFPGGGGSVADVLLRVHPSYLRTVGPALGAGDVHALAHITGGGLPENLARALPDGLEAAVERDSWEVPPEFAEVQRLGGIADEEMFRTFNMGVGMVLAVDSGAAARVAQQIDGAGGRAWRLGVVRPGTGGVVIE